MTRYQNQVVINFLLEQLALVVPTMSNKVAARKRRDVGCPLVAVVCIPNRALAIVAVGMRRDV